MRKKILIVVACLCVCFVAFLFYWRGATRLHQRSEALSPQETLILLEHFNTATAKRKAKLKSAVIDFSVTINRIIVCGFLKEARYVFNK